MKLFRIADTRHAVWSGTGAMLVGGRFNSPGRPVIYAAQTFAGAMLEVLVHARIGKMPKTHGWVEAAVPDDVVVERRTAETLPAGWGAAALQVARQFGDTWLTESRSALLVVPSVVTRAEFNVLVNPAHPEAARIVVADPQPVVWDERLFLAPHVRQS
ncbi:RES family NAD+ phosphorylase [Burkholderia sp. AW49-1]